MKLNDEIDRMYRLREDKRGFEANIKALNVEIELCQQNLLHRLEEVGTNTARGTLASATVTEVLLPQIEDWGEVSEWIKDNDAFYLIHRRISAGPWRELMQAGETVSGISPYKKVSISLRKLGD